MGFGTKSPPPPPSAELVGVVGVEWWLVGAIIGGHTAIFALCYLIYGSQRYVAPVMGGTSKKNKADVGSLKAQIIAYNCVAVWYAITCAYYGSLSWFSGSADAVGPEPFDRVYGRSVDYEIIGMVTAAFETYNTIAVMVIPEYRNAEFIGHHSACLLLTQIASGGPNGAFLHYYGIFFFGVGSVSSVPLALRELFTAVDLPGLAELSEVLFALAFVPIRSIYWLFVSHAFWTDTISLPIKEANSLIAFYLANLGLTGLQLLWTGKIIDGVKGKLGGGKAKKK